MISQKAKYALKALIELTRLGDGETLMAAEIAERQNIPKKFLEQILLELKRQGLVHSRRGPHGGYGLLKAPREITVDHVVRIIDGPLAPLPCLSRTAYRACDDCPDETSCAVRRLFADVYDAHLAALESVSLADVA